MHIEITSENFEKEIINAEKPVIADFWAEWCGPCRMMAPVLEEISEERSDITVAKINVDDEGELANKFNVNAIPTVILFKDGKAAATSVGYKEKEQLLKDLGIRG